MDSTYLHYFLVALNAHSLEDDANGQILRNAVVLEVELCMFRDDVSLAFPLVSGGGNGASHDTLKTILTMKTIHLYLINMVSCLAENLQGHQPQMSKSVKLLCQDA